MKYLLKKNIILIMAMFASCSAFADQSVSYTYNTTGQILTEDGPRTDVSDITTYTYDLLGTRLTASNALSQVIHYNTYDGAGRLLSVTDANGITTEFTYHDRGWLLSSKIKHPTNSLLDSLTSYGYDAVGQMTSMTLPNGYVIGYEYDDARRLTAIKNAANERIEYTLDLAGNRTQQVIKNNAGTITYSVAQAFDELSRVMAVTGNHSQNEKHQYDANDNTTAVTDGRNNKTQQTYDALNRVAKVIDPNLKETKFTYDAQNRIKTVTDARNNVTTYNYDGFGNLTSQVSPDTGTTTFTYDTAGNRISAKDARNVVVNYTYDALNRLTSVKYPAAASENVTYTYDSTANGSYGVGRLSSVTNNGATLVFSYNHLGLISQKQSTLASLTFTTSYAYDLAGNLTDITYPSGRIVTYVRDTAGRVQSMTTKTNATATAQNLVTGVSYLPFGPAKTYSFGNGLSHTASYDNDYRLTAIQVGGVLNRGYGYDEVDNITGITNPIATTKSQSFTYDALNRLTSGSGIYGYQAFSYDDVGNRIGFLADDGTGIKSDTYTYPALSNRLTSISRTIAGAASGTRSFTYDAAGNRTQGTTEDNAVQNTTYNNANRLATAKVGTTLVGTYTYNALGQRVSKVAGSVKEFYHYDEAGQLIAVTDASGKYLREYIYNGNQLVSFVTVAYPSIPSISLTSSKATFQGSAALEKIQTGYTGTVGYVHFTGEGQASWPVTIMSTANYTSTLRYSLTGTDRPLALLIDGVQTATISFPATANLNTWGSARFTVTLALTAGNHTFTLKTTGSGGPNIDTVGIGAVSGQTAAPVSTVYYVHNDHQGTPQVVTNQAKAVVWMADYQPFGKLQPGQANSIELYSRFPGQYVDSETGNYYNYFRDYDPSIGRYIESDPIGILKDFSDPRLQVALKHDTIPGTNVYGIFGLNHLYDYSIQNPIKNVDPFGLSSSSFGGFGFGGSASCPKPPDNREKICRALQASVLATCAALSGPKMFRCFQAAVDTYNACMED